MRAIFSYLKLNFSSDCASGLQTGDKDLLLKGGLGGGEGGRGSEDGLGKGAEDFPRTRKRPVLMYMSMPSFLFHDR